MDIKLARYVARTAFNSSSQINSLVPLLKEHCEQDEYEKYRTRLAEVSFTISQELLKNIFNEHPELEKEFELMVKKYGVV